jgi:hypothetical integral membrane protein (TIGR02206 family)
MTAMAFHAFSAQHMITLAAITALCFQGFRAARVADCSRRKLLARLIGFALLSYVIFLYGQQAYEHALSWEYSLPLDLCNLVLAACIISLFRPSQSATEIAYFWGLGGVLQATLTPDLAQGFPSLDFILFFWSHGATLVAIVFLVSVPGFRPRKSSVVRMMIALNIYGAAVGTVNAVSGWNYGYLCRKPAMPSLIDFLGPWPWYLVSIELIALVTFLLLDLPWRLRGKESSAAAPEDSHPEDRQ